MDMVQAMQKAKDKAWQLQKLPGETDEEFRRRKNIERQRRLKGTGKGAYGTSEAGDWAALEENQ